MILDPWSWSGAFLVDVSCQCCVDWNIVHGTREGMSSISTQKQRAHSKLGSARQILDYVFRSRVSLPRGFNE